MNMPAFSAEIAEPHIKASKSFACGSLGRSAHRLCSRMASQLLRDQSLRDERRLTWRYVR
jgi:hypothetical protein